MSITKKYNKIVGIVDNMKPDIDKVESGTRAAGKRARKGLQEIKKIAHELRKEITEHTKK